MISRQVIRNVLDDDYKINHELFAKLIHLIVRGRFLINDLSPDQNINLAQYLIDPAGIMLDISRLNEAQRAWFYDWLIKAHEQQQHPSQHFSRMMVSEHAGFTAEVSLTWWGRIKNWLRKKSCFYWKLNEECANQIITGVEIHQGLNGIFIHFTQEGIHNTYLEDTQGINSKRLIVTNILLEEIKKQKLQISDLKQQLSSPHPYALPVQDHAARKQQIKEYRKINGLIHEPWYLRIWYWLFPSSRPTGQENDEIKSIEDNKAVSLCQLADIEVEGFTHSSEIIIKEMRPNIENLTFCGGGAKIYGHVGCWQALNEWGIRPSYFSGSSAGAIMALFCYLGYDAEEIHRLFENLKQEHLVHFDIQAGGISDPQALKTALDYAIARRLKEITEKYQISYPRGLITFACLASIREQFPDCGLGKGLVVTATNKSLGKTVYFSLENSAHAEVSEMVKISASFPVIYRPTLIDGAEHNDGGILANLPVDAFDKNGDELLESATGNNLKVLAVQFDNGTERVAVDRVTQNVYKENFFLNLLYEFLTGVKDPASSWMLERLKLRNYGLQSVIINVGNVATTSFSVAPSLRKKMIAAGYTETINYLKSRYGYGKGQYYNDELMYLKFASLADVLNYICYRGKWHLFDELCSWINHNNYPDKDSLLMRAQKLSALHRPEDQNQFSIQKTTHFGRFFRNSIPATVEIRVGTQSHDLLLLLYPLFIKFSPEFFTHRKDRKKFARARHELTLHNPFASLDYLMQIHSPVHILFTIFLILMKTLKEDPAAVRSEYFSMLLEIINLDPQVHKKLYFNQWNLSLDQAIQVLTYFHQQASDDIIIAALTGNNISNNQGNDETRNATLALP